METARNEMVALSQEYALMIIDCTEELVALRKYVIAKQLLQSGTSIAANIHEAQSAESRADFIYKLKIAHNEVREREYGLKRVKASKPNHSSTT